MVTVLMPFLYFPEDKSEYIPAAISFAFFMVLLVLTFMWIQRISKKQELETKDLEERILRERRDMREQQKEHPHS
ncbi:MULTISPECIES: hypothetical protein [unclassified Sporosarcina]|uniref:hypothetical protein n=1 Tax=unclassified Sporosarcina TaxID=2647733 RepID=UPI00057A8FD4|nr:hypothetical protein [Sporosarcina sp. ZBG7A]VDG98780.1 Uncharacterised protein [Lysinibacillus sphaericus]